MPEVLLCSPAERAEKLAELDAGPYFDPTLKQNPGLYVDYLLDLTQCDMVRWDVDIL